MDAFTEIEVGLDARGHSTVRRMRCESPMLVRVADEPGPALALTMVNGAAGPLGGDRLGFRLEVCSGAHVVVRSVAAAMAQPGPRCEPSILEIDLVVGAGAHLDWQPEPMVSVMASDHRTTVRLLATMTSTVRVREGVSLGRHGEPPGRLALRQRVTIDGDAVLDHETVFAPGALLGPGAQGGHRSVVSELRVGSGESLPPALAVVTDECLSATFHLSPICELTTSSFS